MSSAAVAARLPLAAAASRPVAERIRGIDLARGLAIVGMVMVHVGPIRMEGSGIAGAAYRLPHGRASVLFVLVAGMGISLLVGERSRERVRGTTLRLLWRALVLLPAGLALQELPVDVLVILHYYAFYFLLALVAVRLPDRALAGLFGLSALGGPAVVLAARRWQPEWFAPELPEWSDAAHVARDLVVSGTYPAAVWAAPLLAGIWLGRRNLRSSASALWLLAGGAGLAGASYAVHHALAAPLDLPVPADDWRQLAALAPHNEMPTWILSSTGAAAAVAGCCLLAARALPRLLWPAVALGQLALTVYVGHVLVLAIRPEWLERESFAAAWASVGRFALVAILLATAWRALASRGPLEALLHAPWWLAACRERARRRAPPPAQPPLRTSL